MSPRPSLRRTLGLFAGLAVVSALGTLTTPSVVAHAAPAVERSTDVLVQACPLAGSSQFDDTWGAPRSGGRRHEGVDLIAPRGTPVVAVRSGAAQFKQNRLGGNAVWLTTVDGDRFYYAHLDHFEGLSRDVVAGEVIGYVGSTGNAKGPHLHFETHPDGVVVNPFPPTFAACVPPPVPSIERTWTIRPAGTTMTIHLSRRSATR